MKIEIKILIIFALVVSFSSIAHSICVSYETLEWKQQRLNEMWDNWVFLEPIDVRVNQTWNNLFNQTVVENLSKR